MNARREFIKQAALLTSGLLAVNSTYAIPSAIRPSILKNSIGKKISVFSKNLQWLDYENMMAKAASLGFDGVDLTVRPNGHVSPERVRQDLPKVIAAAKKEGLRIYTIVTAIKDSQEPYAEEIVQTATEHGIQFYRMNWYSYEPSLSIQDNLQAIRKKMETLYTINEKYKIHGAYQNHAGNDFGASIWDLWHVLKDFDPRWMGCQFDVRHATVEGANSWPTDFHLIHPYVKMHNLKDFVWENSNGEWTEKNVPLGAGMVNF